MNNEPNPATTSENGGNLTLLISLESFKQAHATGSARIMSVVMAALEKELFAHEQQSWVATLQLTERRTGNRCLTTREQIANQRPEPVRLEGLDSL